MQISWLGYNTFRITSGGVTVIVNPFDPVSGFKARKQSADIVLSNSDVPEVRQFAGSAFTISQPGEYEVKSVFVQGVAHEGATMYLCTVDDVSIAILGGKKIKELSGLALERLEGADVLIVPVGGGPFSTAKEAVALINQIEPRIVVPSYFKIAATKGIESVDVFLKEYAATHERVDKLKVTKKDLPQEDTKVVVLDIA